MSVSTLPVASPVSPAPQRTRRAASLVQALAESGEPWAQKVEYDVTTRWFSRLGEIDGIELWLLSWLPGQGTDLHDHGGAAGAFSVLQGALSEDVVTSVRSHPVMSNRVYATGSVRPFGERHIHRVRNLGDVAAISLHAYEPALRTMTRYEFTQAGLEEIGIEKAGVAW
jgi:Cysteine dioxygenase type I